MNLLDFLIAPAYAQAAPAAQSPLSMFAFPVILLLIMYFLMIRPQMKRAKEHKSMVEALAKGDEVVTQGGVAGRIVKVSDNFITVELAPNVEVAVQRQAVSTVLPKGTLKAL